MKNKNFLHLVAIPFTGLGLHNGYRGDKWFRFRIELFKNYTLKSLLNQTCKDFIVWIAFRPEERKNPITKELYDYLIKLKGFKFIFTFGGCFLWDDKYSNKVAKERLLNSLKISLPELEKFLKSNEPYVYETLQPSDDFYALNEVEEIQKHEPQERGVLQHFQGYVLSRQTQRLADWNPTTINPPFYTIMYPADVFFDPQKHYDYMRESKSHEDIARLFNPIMLPDHKYCVVVHTNNISTNWWHPFRGKIYSHEEAQKILKDFGIDIAVPFLVVSEYREIKFLLRYWIGKMLMAVGFYKYAKYAKNKLEEWVRNFNKN